MIRLYGTTDTTFTNNGDITLQMLRCVVHNADNGDFYADCECGLEYVNEITANRIIRIPTPQGDQSFRIGDVTRTRKRISFQAWHVYYDTETISLTRNLAAAIPTPAIVPTCAGYLTAIGNYVQPSNPFTATSDITTVRYPFIKRGSYLEAVNQLIAAFGGHLVRDDFSFAINSSIGQDRGVTIRYGSNMKDITVEEDWSAVCTRCYPIGKDGITLASPGYVESATQYDIPYTRTIEFEQGIERDDYPSQADYEAALRADLQTQAQTYVDNACYPSVNYTLHANIETMTDIGDTIQVVDTRLGLNLFTTVISYNYDAILGRYTEIEFGNFRKTLSGFASSITTIASNTAIAQVTTDVSAQIQAAKLEMFPVGSIYMSINSTDPASFIGGTWQRIQDTFLLAAGSSYAAGATGGEATHKLTTAELPKHKHEGLYWQSIAAANQIGLNNDNSTGYQLTWTGNRGPNTNHKLITAEAGSGTAHNNMPPYLSVYMWKRTA